MYWLLTFLALKRHMFFLLSALARTSHMALTYLQGRMRNAKATESLVSTCCFLNHLGLLSPLPSLLVPLFLVRPILDPDWGPLTCSSCAWRTLPLTSSLG